VFNAVQPSETCVEVRACACVYVFKTFLSSDQDIVSEWQLSYM